MTAAKDWARKQLKEQPKRLARDRAAQRKDEKHHLWSSTHDAAARLESK